MRCENCPVWQVRDVIQVCAGTVGDCDVGPLYLRRAAAKHRLVAQRLDKAAEMREREEAQP